MGGVIALGLLLGVLLGWKARRMWGEYKVRRHFQRLQEKHWKLRRQEDEELEKKARSSDVNGWTK